MYQISCAVLTNGGKDVEQLVTALYMSFDGAYAEFFEWNSNLFGATLPKSTDVTKKTFKYLVERYFQLKMNAKCRAKALYHSVSVADNY
jgi:hypothetical protein